MPGIFAKDFKFIVLREENLPDNGLNHVIVHCKTIQEFKNALGKYNSYILKLVCTEDYLCDISPLVQNLSVEIIYILKGANEILWPAELDMTNIQLKEILNEQQLMRYLCLDAVLLYYKQSIEYKNEGENGLNNMFVHQSLEALNCAANFV